MADRVEGEPDGEPKPDLKFVGGRFNGKGFPLDGLPELAKYQRLLVEVAKQIWVEQNPGKTLPDNIADKVRLRLIEIQDGSQKTYFAAEEDQAFDGVPTLREMAESTVYDIFKEIIQDNFGSLADATPGVVVAFRQVGSSFGDDEMIALRPEQPEELRYGLGEHRDLLNGLKGLRYERTGTLVGTLGTLDAGNKFTLIDAQGEIINGKFSDAGVWGALHTLHSQKQAADWIWIECDYVISETDGTVVRINDVREADLFGKSSDPWAVRLARFATLPEGHAEGEGERTEAFALLAALQVLDAISEAGWDEPAIFAALEGGVRMEWLSDHEHMVLTVDNDAHFYAFHLNDETDEEAIEEPVGPKAAIEFIEGFLA